jgi:NADH-quinone oxidoreductase subunit L
MVVGVAGIGWFLMMPHADARADDAELRRTGRVVLTAAPGLGYGYRWHAEGEQPSQEFGGSTSYTVLLDWCQEKTVHLDVRNALAREATAEFRYCRSNPIIAGCCVPGVPPPKLPTMPPRPPRLDPGRYDAGVIQDLLSPNRGSPPGKPKTGQPPQPERGEP